MGSPPLRVAKDKNFPDLVPTDTSNYNNEGDTWDKDISPPACNTHSQRNSLSIMDEVMLSCFIMSRISCQIDPQKAASRKYPLKLFWGLAGTVLEGETGNLYSTPFTKKYGMVHSVKKWVAYPKGSPVLLKAPTP